MNSCIDQIGKGMVISFAFEADAPSKTNNPTSLWLKWSRTFVKSSSQHPFNPISSNSPGGGVYPSSYLLPWGLDKGFARTRNHLYPIFSPSWPSSFFHHFSNPLLYRFWLHFGAQLGAKFPPKSIKNPSQEWSGTIPTFFTSFSSNFEGFGTSQNLKSSAPVEAGS